MIVTDRDFTGGNAVANELGSTAICVLLAPDGAGYMTGAEINIDGGLLAGSIAAPARGD